MPAGIHGNSYNSRGNGIFLYDESRRRLAAQDLRRRGVDLPVSNAFFWQTLRASIKQSEVFAKIKRRPPESPPSTARPYWHLALTGDPPDPDPSSLCASPSFPASSASIWTVGQVLGRH